VAAAYLEKLLGELEKSVMQEGARLFGSGNQAASKEYFLAVVRLNGANRLRAEVFLNSIMGSRQPRDPVSASLFKAPEDPPDPPPTAPPLDPAAKYRNAWLRLIVPKLRADSRSHLMSLGQLRDLEWSPEQEKALSFERHGGLVYRASQILTQHGEELIRSFDSVSGVALSFRYRHGEVIPEEPCITFFVSRKQPLHALERPIPPTIDAVPTDVVEAGVPELHRASAGHSPGSKLRPAEPGCSISHLRVTSGSFGCLVEDDHGVLYMLSCAHVLSDASGSKGDAVLQPGTYFGSSTPADQIASLTRCVPLNPGKCVADAAIAEVRNPTAVSAQIRYIGTKPVGTLALNGVGQMVQKSGDESGLTSGVVVATNGTAGFYSVNGVSNIYFTDAIVTTGMSEPGDSGSLLMDNTSRAVGLLFGGLKSVPSPPGPVRTVVSWYNPIDVVLQNLGVHLAP
jgi:hypothetical protein